jgi:hypothetical protein
MNIFMPLIKQKYYSNEIPANNLDTGWKLGGTAANISYGIVPWTNPSNVLTDSTSAAFADAGSNFDYTDKLRVTNFDFAIPGGATVTGIEMKYRRRTTTNNDVKDDTIKLVLSGTEVGANKATTSFWSNVNETPEYGGPLDLWSWGSATPTNINDSTFGIDIAAFDDDTGVDDCWIEAVWMKITYTL